MQYYVYLYENKFNGMCYVGETNNIKDRYATHKIHNKTKFEKAITEFGVDNFIFTVVNVVDTKLQATLEEAYWIATLRDYLGKENVYNVRATNIRNGTYKTEEELKARDREYSKEYDATHKEYKKAYKKAYRESHKEEISIKNKIYAETHKEEIRARLKANYEANKGV